MSHSRMIRRGVAAGGIALATLAVAACASTEPPPVPAGLIPPATVTVPGHPGRPACAGPIVTFVEGASAPCDVRPPERLDYRMIPGVIGGQTWIVRCGTYGGTVDTTSGASFMCRGVDY